MSEGTEKIVSEWLAEFALPDVVEGDVAHLIG